MEYVVKEITETVDFLELSESEFNAINNLFYEVVSTKYPNLKKYAQIGDIKKCILTDDFTRIEFIIKSRVKQGPPEQPPPPLTSSSEEQLIQ